MQHRTLEAPLELQDTIHSFWYTRVEAGELTEGFRIMPDAFVELVFLFGGPCSIATADGLQPLSSPYLMGLLDQPAILHREGCLETIGIRCYPWMVFDLLGLPAVKDRVPLVRHSIAALQPVLAELIRAGKVDAALLEAQRYFSDARPGTDRDAMLAKAGTAMSEAAGTLPVGGVAAAAHATVRTLERRFKQSSGHTVKDVSALMRFEQVRNRLWLHPATGLAGLAAELGYTDQAHLSREFRRFSGTTPAVFARKTRQARQAFGNDFVAFVQV